MSSQRVCLAVMQGRICYCMRLSMCTPHTALSCSQQQDKPGDNVKCSMVWLNLQHPFVHSDEAIVDTI